MLSELLPPPSTSAHSLCVTSSSSSLLVTSTYSSLYCSNPPEVGGAIGTGDRHRMLVRSFKMFSIEKETSSVLWDVSLVLLTSLFCSRSNDDVFLTKILESQSSIMYMYFLSKIKRKLQNIYKIHSKFHVPQTIE